MRRPAPGRRPRLRPPPRHRLSRRRPAPRLRHRRRRRRRGSRSSGWTWPGWPATATEGVRIGGEAVARGAPDGECGGGNRRGPARPAPVTGATYGNVVGDDRTDAVVTVACAGSAPHASVYSLAPGGVARVAAIEP